ncbi:hypothetical protein LY76DRAFT_599547, partial [Colletotrichum caudatum]
AAHGRTSNRQPYGQAHNQIPQGPTAQNRCQAPNRRLRLWTIILSHSSRLAKLHEICTTARADRETYPRDAECWDSFRGSKNVLIFTKWPILAYLIQLWFEKYTDHECFRSALIHAELNRTERQEVVDWFRTFTVEGGRPKTFTKVLVTTYGLCGTGLDGLKVAN